MRARVKGASSFEWKIFESTRRRNADQVAHSLGLPALLRRFFLELVLHGLGLIATTGGSNGLARYASAGRGGGGGSLKYASSSPKRSSSLTYALGLEYDVFLSAEPVGQLGYAQDEYGLVKVVDAIEELKLLRCEDALDEKLIGLLIGDDAGEDEGEEFRDVVDVMDDIFAGRSLRRKVRGVAGKFCSIEIVASSAYVHSKDASLE